MISVEVLCNGVWREYPGETFVIKMAPGAPVVFVRETAPNHIVLSTIRDPDFRDLVKSCGIPITFKIETPTLPPGQSVEQMKQQLLDIMAKRS